MPLMKPEVQKVLRAAGLAKESSSSNDSTVSQQLDAAGLSLESTLEELSHLAHNSGNEALRLRALETVLKAHGALKETAPPPPSFTIVIQDSQTPTEGVNPILLPRQLLKELKNKDIS